MRTISWNKKEKMILCHFCGRNPIPLGKWKRPCEECKKRLTQVKDKKYGVKMTQRQPAAIVTDDSGKQVFTDKAGNIVDNPGYDLKNDPRGQKFTGVTKKKRDYL